MVLGRVVATRLSSESLVELGAQKNLFGSSSNIVGNRLVDVRRLHTCSGLLIVRMQFQSVHVHMFVNQPCRARDKQDDDDLQYNISHELIVRLHWRAYLRLL